MAGVIGVRELSVTLPGGRELLRVPSLEVVPGETVFLSGESGSGKSTVLNILSGTVVSAEESSRRKTDDAASSSSSRASRAAAQAVLTWNGSITVAGRVLGRDPIAQYRSALFRLAQNPQLEEGEVEETFLSTRRYRVHRSNQDRFSDARINAVLEALGLPPSIRQQPVRTISGGEAARVAIARMILLDRPVLLLDEPTAALDSARASTIIEVIRSFVASDTTIVVASHDHALRKGAHRVYEITDRVVEPAVSRE
ncbi:MAG: ATP-binding cassette domain-containing protein [Alkalispirochaeta sp.]